MRTFYIIAGEPSGDALGAKLMRALSMRLGTEARFRGIGGPKMIEEGLTSLFPYEQLSLMGFLEVVPHLPRLMERIRETVEAALRLNPDVVITIDSPGFNFQVAKRLKAAKPNLKLIHYVAPSVWAYKPERAEKMAQWYNQVLCLLPFEPPYFDQVGLKATFVGHPLVEDEHKPYGPAGNYTILMLPGSRRGEIKRHMPVFLETAWKLQEKGIEYAIVMPTLPHLAEGLKKETREWPLEVRVITDKEAKDKAYRNASVALVKSGTIALELAQFQVPMVVTYKVNPISAWMLRRMIKVKYVNLVNLLLNRPAIPELLQGDCNAKKLSETLIPLITNREARANQQAAMREALSMLGAGKTPTPSEKAAAAILSELR